MKIILLFMNVAFLSVLFSCASTNQTPINLPKHKNDCEVEKIEYDGRLIDLSKTGIGASVEKPAEGSAALIADIAPDGPVSQSSKIQVGDQILSISENGDGEFWSTRSMSLDQINAQLTGCARSSLTLILKRENDLFKVDLERQGISLNQTN